jgi:hypothetical protein
MGESGISVSRPLGEVMPQLLVSACYGEACKIA